MKSTNARVRVVTVLSVVALAGTAGANVILYEQTFDGPGLPPDWSFDANGDWSIVSGTLDQGYAIPMLGHADAWAGDLGWADYSVETDFMFLEFGEHNMEAGLGLRHDQLGTNGNFFVSRVSWRGGSEGWNLEIVRTNASEIHIPLNQTLAEDVWYTMRCEITDDYLQVWVNDILYDVGSVNTDGFVAPASGNVGVWSNMAHTQFDNLVVRGEAPVPEPATITMLLAMGAGLAASRRVRRRKGD
jgi:PEP-CTERM motif